MFESYRMLPTRATNGHNKKQVTEVISEAPADRRCRPKMRRPRRRPLE
jgi:hypothetical protein